jgi:hypothetical protein
MRSLYAVLEPFPTSCPICRRLCSAPTVAPLVERLSPSTGSSICWMRSGIRGRSPCVNRTVGVLSAGPGLSQALTRHVRKGCLCDHGRAVFKGSVEPIQGTWDGKQTGDSSRPVVVVSCYAVAFDLRQWCFAFDKDGKLVSRWEQCPLN